MDFRCVCLDRFNRIFSFFPFQSRLQYTILSDSFPGTQLVLSYVVRLAAVS